MGIGWRAGQEGTSDVPNPEFGVPAGGHMSTLWSGLGVTGLARCAYDDGGEEHVTKTPCDLSVDDCLMVLVCD